MNSLHLAWSDKNICGRVLTAPSDALRAPRAWHGFRSFNFALRYRSPNDTIYISHFFRHESAQLIPNCRAGHLQRTHNACGSLASPRYRCLPSIISHHTPRCYWVTYLSSRLANAITLYIFVKMSTAWDVVLDMPLACMDELSQLWNIMDVWNSMDVVITAEFLPFFEWECSMQPL